MKRENWCRSRVCLCDKVPVCNSTVAASATLSRDKVAHSCDKIAQVCRRSNSLALSMISLSLCWAHRWIQAIDNTHKMGGRQKRSFGDMLADRQTDTQTDIIIATLCLYFSTKCHLLMTELIVAFVLFIFMLVLLCFCVTTVSR